MRLNISTIIDIIINLDKYLGVMIDKFGIFSYVILFLIIFAETGLIVAPFLPGDSLLFVAGTFAAVNSLNLWVLYFIFLFASVLGDTTNYWVGKYIGIRATKNRFVKKEYIDKTKKFYEKHGSKTIVLARFIPIIRTFAPFIAGVGKMDYTKFLIYNVVGGFLWTSLFVFGGYFFGNLEIVRENLSFFILGIIMLSFIPMIIEVYKHYKNK